MACQISVLMPAYNASATIAESMDSVLAQTFFDLELIVVDDGSVDSTAQIVAEYAARDSRVKYFYKDNAGPSAARNFALAKATGRYVSIIDSDDLWHPDKLAKQMQLMDSDDDVVVLTGNQIFYRNDGQEQRGQINFPPPVNGERYRGLDIASVDLGQMVLINTALIGRGVLRGLGGWDVSKWTAEDWHLWLRVTAGNRFRVIAEPLVLYRKHPQSLTSRQKYFEVAVEHEKIIREARALGLLAAADVQDALLKRWIEAWGVFLYQAEIGHSLKAFGKTFMLPRAWLQRRFFVRVVETMRLIAKQSGGQT